MRIHLGREAISVPSRLSEESWVKSWLTPRTCYLKTIKPEGLFRTVMQRDSMTIRFRFQSLDSEEGRGGGGEKKRRRKQPNDK